MERQRMGFFFTGFSSKTLALGELLLVMGSLEGSQGRFFGFSIAFLKLLFTKNCIPCICKKYFKGCLTFQLRFLKKRYDIYPCYLLCFPYPYFPIICILPKQKRLHYMQTIKWKGRIYVIGLLSKLTIKKSVFLQKHTREHAAVQETAFLDSI